MAMRITPTSRRATFQRPFTSEGCRKYREPSALMVVTESRFGCLGAAIGGWESRTVRGFRLRIACAKPRSDCGRICGVEGKSSKDRHFRVSYSMQ